MHSHSIEESIGVLYKTDSHIPCNYTLKYLLLELYAFCFVRQVETRENATLNSKWNYFEPIPSIKLFAHQNVWKFMVSLFLWMI